MMDPLVSIRCRMTVETFVFLLEGISAIVYALYPENEI
jgi:hypothetical protein